MSRFALCLALLIPAICFADVVTFTPHDTAIKKGQNWVLLNDYKFVQDSFAQNCPLAKNTRQKITREVVDTAGIIAVEQGIADSLVPLAVSAGGKPIISSTEPIITYSGFSWLTRNSSVLKKMVRFNQAKLSVANAPAEPSLANSVTDWSILLWVAAIALLSIVFVFAPKKKNGWWQFFWAVATSFFLTAMLGQLISVHIFPNLDLLLKITLLPLFSLATIFFIVAIINRKNVRTGLRLVIVAAILAITGYLGWSIGDFWALCSYLLIFLGIFILFIVIPAIIRGIIKLFGKKKHKVLPKATAIKKEPLKQPAAKEETLKKAEIKKTETTQTETK